MLNLVATFIVLSSANLRYLTFGDSYNDFSICNGGALICQNQGVCINDTSCLCYPGFDGTDCSEDVTCPPISTLLSNGLIQENQGNAYGSLVTYTCRYGYQVQGAVDSNPVTKTVFCNVNGAWIPDVVNCLPMCSVIPVWNGYTIIGDNYQRLSGSVIQYVCGGSYDQSYAVAFGVAQGTQRYQFADGSNAAKVSYCINGEWIPPIVQCIDGLYATS